MSRIYSNKKILKKAVKSGYIVTNEGRLFNSKTKKYRKLKPDTTGYYRVSIKYAPYKNKHLAVHRLMAFQKFGNKLFNEGFIVRHRNGNILDNSYKNILIGTTSDNQLDIPKEIRIRRASVAYRRFTNNEAKKIIEDRRKGLTYRILCKKYNVCKSFLSYLFNDSLYKDKLSLKIWDKSQK